MTGRDAGRVSRCDVNVGGVGSGMLRHVCDLRRFRYLRGALVVLRWDIGACGIVRQAGALHRECAQMSGGPDLELWRSQPWLRVDPCAQRPQQGGPVPGLMRGIGQCPQGAVASVVRKPAQEAGDIAQRVVRAGVTNIIVADTPQHACGADKIVAQRQCIGRGCWHGGCLCAMRLACRRQNRIKCAQERGKGAQWFRKEVIRPGRTRRAFQIGVAGHGDHMRRTDPG